MFEAPPPQTNSPELLEAVSVLHFKVLEHRLSDVWMQFVEAGFKPILIKGWAAAQLYPKPFERQFSDVDLAFDPKDFARAEEFAAGRVLPLPVDLHCGLRHLDTLPFPELFARSVFIKCGGVDIRVLSAEDHLRVLAVHWLNDGGAPRERLKDIYYAVENRPSGFSWERCLNVVSRRRRRWIVCAVGLAHLYLNLPVADLPFEDELNDLPRWLIKTVENEWASAVRLKPLEQCRHDRQEFWRQIKKRIPPNALQATIETGGDFDQHPRFYYQALDVYKRALPWLRRARGRFRGAGKLA